jgi:hypothetical protein
MDLWFTWESEKNRFQWTVFFWVIRQRAVVISLEISWEITTTRCVITQKSAVLSCVATKAWNHAICPNATLSIRNPTWTTMEGVHIIIIVALDEHNTKFMTISLFYNVMKSIYFLLILIWYWQFGFCQTLILAKRTIKNIGPYFVSLAIIRSKSYRFKFRKGSISTVRHW